MRGSNLGVSRERWKKTLLEVIASQGEVSFLKGEIISQAAVKVGYAPYSAPPAALAALLELEREEKVEEFHVGNRGNSKGYRLIEDGKPSGENATSLSGSASDSPIAAASSDPPADLARLCTELFAFFEKTGEGLVSMARAGKALIEDLGRAQAEGAPPLSRHEQKSDAALEKKVDRLSDQIAALSELFGVQKREFEARQAGILSMLEQEARRRGNGTHSQEARRDDSNKDAVGTPWRSRQ